MGESKRRKIIKEAVDQLTKDYVDKGMIVEAGWAAFRYISIRPDAPEIQLSEMRLAFFSGAHHVFSSIISVMDPGEEPTEKDMERLSLIYKELDKFVEEFKFRYSTETEGSA